MPAVISLQNSLSPFWAQWKASHSLVVAYKCSTNASFGVTITPSTIGVCQTPFQGAGNATFTFQPSLPLSPPPEQPEFYYSRTIGEWSGICFRCSLVIASARSPAIGCFRRAAFKTHVAPVHRCWPAFFQYFFPSRLVQSENIIDECFILVRYSIPVWLPLHRLPQMPLRSKSSFIFKFGSTTSWPASSFSKP